MEEKQRYHQWFKPIISSKDIESAFDLSRVPKKIYAYEISSLVDVIEFAENYKGVTSEWGDDDAESVGDRAWHGTKTFEHCILMMKNGFGIEQVIADMEKNLENVVVEDVPQVEYRFDNTGLAVDVGKFMEGTPEAFLESDEVYENEQIVQIDVFGCYSSRTSSNTIMYNAIDLIRRLKRYEQQRIRVKIVMWIANHQDEYKGRFCDSYATILKVNIKSHDEDYNLHKIACFFHTSFFRRIIFKFMEQSGQVTKYSYGEALPSNRKDMYYLNRGATGDGASVEELVDKKLGV